jgi:beta-xylosidase
LIKEGDTYYMMYSANCYQGKNYAVGYATSKSPLGPFQKAANNPVLQENVSQGGTVMGTGHNLIITLPNGQRYCVYHGRMSDNPTERVVLMDKMNISEEGILTVEGPTTESQEICIK